MNPIAFQIGPLSVRWYGILIASGLLIGLFLAMREAKRQNLDPEIFVNLIIVAVPVGIVFARLYYVVFNWSAYAEHPAEIFKVWHGGLAIHGAVLGGVAAGYIFTRVNKLRFWQLADIAAPSLILAQSIGRWGNFINQEAYGRVTDLPWGMYIAGARRHPTFLYESLWDFGVFLFLIAFRRREKIKEGDIFALYLILYSVGRFFIEGLRTDSLMIGPFRTAQVVSVILILLGMGIMIYHRRKKV
jgi:phosphatidylglycerol:prolipoprotein diacylglycerol transferase